MAKTAAKKLKTTKDIERQFEVLRTLLAIGIALGIAFLIILVISDAPMAALKSFTTGPVGNLRRMGNVLEVMTPLLFTGTAVSIIFSANQTNMAVEGGFFFGAVGGAYVASQLEMAAGLHSIVSMIAGGLCGALVCFIPAILFVKFGAKPVVSSLMMNYVCLYMGLFVINNIIRDPSAGFMASHKFKPTAVLPGILNGTKVHMGLVIGLIVITLGYLYLYKSKRGYEIRIVGKNVDFAKYSGIPVGKVLISAQLIGGVLAGLGGTVEILGMYPRFQYQQLTNHGFDGILVGIIARFNPRLVPVTAFFLAYIRVGADIMARTNDIPIELVQIIQAIIIMLVVAEQFLYRSKHKRIVAASRQEIAGKVESAHE